MNLAAMLVVGLMTVASAMASERIVNLKVFNNRLQLDGNVSQFHLVDIRQVKVDSKVKYVEDRFCNSDSVSCEHRIVLERVPALQITVSYFKAGTMDTDGIQYENLFVPVDSLDAETLAKLKKNTTVFDFLQRRLRVRKSILQANFDLKATSRQVQISVIDYGRSTICSSDDGPWCQEELFYVPKTITVKDVVVNKKS
jgi:hypothetical protein